MMQMAENPTKIYNQLSQPVPQLLLLKYMKTEQLKYKQTEQDVSQSWQQSRLVS